MKAVGDTLAAFRADVANRYLDLGTIIPLAAESLLSANQPEAAFAVAELGARDYPNSVAANVILAYVADKTNRPDVALRAARRTQELEPTNRTARDIIAKSPSR